MVTISALAHSDLFLILTFLASVLFTFFALKEPFVFLIASVCWILFGLEISGDSAAWAWVCIAIGIVCIIMFLAGLLGLPLTSHSRHNRRRG